MGVGETCGVDHVLLLGKSGFAVSVLRQVGMCRRLRWSSRCKRSVSKCFCFRSAMSTYERCVLCVRRGVAMVWMVWRGEWALVLCVRRG